MERLAMMAPIPDWGEWNAMMREAVPTTRITEAQAARHPDAIAGKAALEARLERLPPVDQAAFYRAIRLCFASGCSVVSDAHGGE